MMLLLLLAPAMVTLCAHAQDRMPAPAEDIMPAHAQDVVPAHAQDVVPAQAQDVPAARTITAALARGMASWYGPRFHGRRTASGEPFDMHALTAAHPTLPFGTVVQVRSLINGRTVEVRINDRGPYIKRRVIDLSRAAADALGLLEAGTGTKPVELAIVGLDRGAVNGRRN